MSDAAIVKELKAIKEKVFITFYALMVVGLLKIASYCALPNEYGLGVRCVEYGYSAYVPPNHCIRTVDGSDEVVSLEYLEGEALREFQAVRGASDE